MRTMTTEESTHCVLQTTNTALYTLHRVSRYILIATHYSPTVELRKLKPTETKVTKA